MLHRAKPGDVPPMCTMYYEENFRLIRSPERTVTLLTGEMEWEWNTL